MFVALRLSSLLVGTQTESPQPGVSVVPVILNVEPEEVNEVNLPGQTAGRRGSGH